MFATLRAHLSYANVMATVAVFIALGGSSYAALRVTGRNVPKDSLTGADIKNLTGKDVKNRSLTGKDEKKDSISGTEINESSLAEVPNANTANTANTASTAGTANNIAPPEGYREVGTPDNPAFGADCGHYIAMTDAVERVAFYKDHEGVVHLRGTVQCTGSNGYAFQLPPGYRPRNGRVLLFDTYSFNGSDEDDPLYIYGAGTTLAPDGAVSLEGTAPRLQALDGVSFRAEG